MSTHHKRPRIRVGDIPRLASLPDDVYEVPSGWQEVAVFRRPDRLYNVIPDAEIRRQRREYAHLQNYLQPERQAWWEKLIQRKGLAKMTARADWEECAKVAESLLDDMEKTQIFTSPERLQVMCAIAILRDASSNVNDKRQAVKNVGDMFAVFQTRRQESNLKEREKQEIADGKMKDTRAEDDASALDATPTISLLERLKGADGAADVS